MSAPQLDILALEPYYGGARRAMLDTLVRRSRHRWTVLKLPPRRIERRLSVAANWFGEQLTRHWVGRVDLVFTSEAMNLANLYQLMPPLAGKPSVVYFHENQLPDIFTNTDSPLDLVNLNTANAATEIWFNSEWHRRTFLARAGALVDRHPELAVRKPIPRLKSKSSVVAPPVDFSAVTDALDDHVRRDATAVFVETRGGEVGMLSKALATLRERKERYRLITVGPADGLDGVGDVPRQAVAESDDAAQARALCEAAVFVSVKPDAASDFLAVRALAAGCRMVLPDSGFYPELLPPTAHASSLYEVSPYALADRLQEAISPYAIAAARSSKQDLRRAIARFDPAVATKNIDERFEEVVWVRAVD